MSPCALISLNSDYYNPRLRLTGSGKLLRWWLTILLSLCCLAVTHGCIIATVKLYMNDVEVSGHEPPVQQVLHIIQVRAYGYERVWWVREGGRVCV